MTQTSSGVASGVIRQAGQSNQWKKNTSKEEFLAMSARPSQPCSKTWVGRCFVFTSCPVLSKWPEGEGLEPKTPVCYGMSPWSFEQTKNSPPLGRLRC